MSQVARCASINLLPPRSITVLAQRKQKQSSRWGDYFSGTRRRFVKQAVWRGCKVLSERKRWATELSLMGYSMRTLEYRYTAYYPFNRTRLRPDLSAPEPYEEELFDHKNESLSDFTHREIVNLAYKPTYAVVISNFRTKMKDFLTASFSRQSPYALK
jgi:hypothetical protein